MKLKKILFVLSCLCLTAGVLFCSGCGDKPPREVRKVSAVRGRAQCAMPGKSFPERLQVRVDDAEGSPLAGQKIRFVPQAGSDLKVHPAEGVSDAGGIVMTTVTAGKQVGDLYLLAIPESKPERAAVIRFISGVELGGLSQEASSGSALKEPISVKLVDASGKPAANAKVFFSLADEPGGGGAKLTKTSAVTNADGVASSGLVVGSKTGKYKVSIDVSGPASFRPLVVDVMGLNLGGLLVGVAGGLALFVFGMTLMSNGLQVAAGERMRGLLRFFSSNRVMAIISGALVTAVLQSSSATTVMVIGFINAGLLSLVQSLGIIFGANIGTTMTAQLVAFKLNDVVMPTIIAGLIISFIKWRPLRGWGEMLLGFGLLFFGMQIMSSDLKVIADFPSFQAFFRTFDCQPVNGSIPYVSMLGAIVIGILMTVVLQSSSATTGIVIALGAGGLVNLYTAVALILGSNVGTTITAQLAALAANRVAKQAALAHTLFNVIGVIIVVSTFWITWGDTGVPVFFYLVNFFTEGNAFASIPQNIPRHIANAHTLFNVFTTLLLMPVIPLLARICERLLPVKAAKVRYQYLEPHLINNPAIALDQTVMVMRRMLRKAWKMVDRSIKEYFIFANVDEEGFAALEKREKRIDDLQTEITNYLTLVMQRKLSERQAKVLPLLMHCTNDAERVADHTEVILMLTRRLAESGHKLSEEAMGELNELRDRLCSQAECAISLLDRYEDNLRIQAEKDEEEISRMVKRFEETHIDRLREQKCNAATGVIFIELLGEVEKISSRLSNIVERALPISQRSAVPSPVRKPVAPSAAPTAVQTPENNGGQA